MSIHNKIMKEYTETELSVKYDEFIKMLDKYFSGERLEKLKHMYSDGEYGYRLTTAPASSKIHYHNAFPGGYLCHINNVIFNCLGIKKLYECQGVVCDFEVEELIFAAIHHDLYKLGDEDHEFYVFETNDWQTKNRGSVYKVNPKIRYMDGVDQTMMILQRYGIKYSWKEFLGMKLADGMYSEDNVKYLKTVEESKSMRTLLPAILHSADYTSMNVERNEYRESLKK